MTAAIGSLIGKATAVLDRLAGSQEKVTGTGEFSAVLASATGVATGALRAKETRRGAAEPETLAGDENAAPDEAALAAAATAAMLTTSATTASADNAGLAAAGELAGSTAELAGAETEATAAEETGPAEGANVNAVNKDLAGLVPEFRSRLDRVIDRMEEEFGHRVTVVEAQRSQARQNHLYEQGRSRPGPVVTWTRNSNHITGRAVDVMIDGSYGNPRAFERLAEIAAQEGLHTLGARDPGHVELPRGIDGGGLPSLAFSAVEAIPTGPAGVARVAEVASVAQPAHVANVADLARVAEVARPADPARPFQPQATPAAAEIAAASLAAGTSANGRENSNSGSRQRHSDSQLASAIQMEMMRSDPGLGRAFGAADLAPAQPGVGTDAVQRAAQILALKENASNAPVNHLLLRLDSPSGGEDRIRVDLRGSVVETTLNIDNRGEAERLASRVSELRQSLGNHGLDAEAVRIRTTTSPLSTDRVDLARAAIADVETGKPGTRTGSDSSHPREGWKEAQGQMRRDPSDPRNRSRKERPNEEKA